MDYEDDGHDSRRNEEPRNHPTYVAHYDRREDQEERPPQCARDRLGPQSLDAAQRDREMTVLEFFCQVEDLARELRL